MAPRVLVVDDATSIVTLVKATLEARGYQVDAAYNGSEGLALAKLFTPSDLADRVTAVLDPKKADKTKSEHDQKSAQLRAITDIMHRPRD